ncbi:hypothetical protein N7468_005406 [Penicillium chermesinum]|uniref:Disease resistance R13L4/SHOC-2-like LRR domain-containing protein n=1 Tax=Penicillium chermesinum TaxID=63820 RepID=A0A9W9TMY4_9EURO|nr:uncharacterized protein N7468_005406 [Penicillium chermesinum]KAJ5232450.1 hypothetical protein N7468_005406 [Penicillium chermesinum]
MLSAVPRPEDTVRGPRSYPSPAEEEEGESRPHDSLVPPPLSYGEGFPNMEPEGSRPGTAMGDSSSKRTSGPKPLTPEETIELARRAVESGIQDTKRSLAGSEAVTDVVKPKLTIDLGHSHIVRIPEPVVDIIKDEVERLSLSNNHLFHIPYRFAECSHLRYLNVRANNFREFPKGVYKLPLLEILDLSRNKINTLPDEIKKLKSLRVLSVMQNRLDELPIGLSDMNKLQILKVAGNPLRWPLRRVLESTEAEIASSGMTDNEKEVAVTAELKIFLKNRQIATTPEPETSADTSEGSFEAPKPIPVKRKLSGRFPVKPSTGDSSASSSRSPSISRAPGLPSKNHYRMASGHQAAAYHMSGIQRPGIAPYAVNERNRSNSEGIIQASFAARNKRMGVITRKNTDLGPLTETRADRNSHLRGLSHGSVLRSRPVPTAVSGSSSSSPSSPRDRRRQRDGWVNRMSSLPEHKGERGSDDPVLESAKGILFALFQIHSHISALINVIKADDTRRHSLELVFYNASSHVTKLNEALEHAETAVSEDLEAGRMATEAVKRECATCIGAYTHVGTQLRNSAGKIVSNGDSRYVRSLMLMMYGSLVELRNACSSLRIPLSSNQKRTSAPKASIPDVARPPPLERPPRPLVTPTRDTTAATKRFRSDTTIRHPQPVPLANSNQMTNSSPGFATPSFNASRSRSSSRSNLINTSVPSSLATPRSGEAFPPIPPGGPSRINPLTGLDENEEERIFEKIFHQLTSAYSAALQALPLARRQLSRCLEVAEQSRESDGMRMIWNNLIRRCKFCLEASEALGMRLSSMKVKEPNGGLRNQREFWQLCKTFMQSFVDLVTDMKEVRSMQLLPQDIVIILRPVQKASQQAGRLIEASPWSYLADMYGPPMQPPHIQHQTSVSASAITSHPSPFLLNTNMSPQSVTVPATPLSAALGPAAQATVPTTPASAYSDRFFEGDVFQRADSLLSMPNQTPFFGRR